MSAGKIIGGLLAAAGVGAGIYLGFVKKDVDGLSAFARLTGGKKPEEKKPDATSGAGQHKQTLQDPTSDPVHGTGTPAPVPDHIRPAPPVIGGNLYSQYGGSIVYNVKDGSKYKTAAKGEYIGKISGTDGGAYLIASGTQKVWMSGTIIK